ncbi:MAG TPA: GNAT family N-acetyltransferase [Roseiflexaceae bacterium]
MASVQRSSATSLLTELLGRLSNRMIWLRYLLPRRLPTEAAWAEAARMVQRRAWRHTTLVVVAQTGGREDAIAMAELARGHGAPDTGEVVLVVRDDWQRRGIGGTLAGQLIRLATLSGVTSLRADLLPRIAPSGGRSSG